jgi:periplasmic protein TonB
MLQSQIDAGLQANEKSRDAAFRTVARVWLDNSGRVSRVQLSPSTGDNALDVAIRDQVVGGLRAREPPPKDMPMPMIIRLTGQNRG